MLVNCVYIVHVTLHIGLRVGNTGEYLRDPFVDDVQRFGTTPKFSFASHNPSIDRNVSYSIAGIMR